MTCRLKHDGRIAGRALASLTALALLSACSVAPEGTEINDPYESTNRKIHEGSVRIDRAVLRPVSMAYGGSVPEPVRRSVSNFASNLDAPGDVMNDVLQGNVEDAVHNLFRFVLNTTVGIGGLFDPAHSFGLDQRPSDFGETLHVWGTPEGAYQVLPVFGPSTERDTAGRVVDFVLNPIGELVPDLDLGVRVAAGAGSVADNRYRYATSIDSVLYDSADGYAQARTIYLQNRRFQLGGGEADLPDDPYEDLYAE